MERFRRAARALRRAGGGLPRAQDAVPGARNPFPGAGDQPYRVVDTFFRAGNAPARARLLEPDAGGRLFRAVGRSVAISLGQRRDTERGALFLNGWRSRKTRSRAFG